MEEDKNKDFQIQVLTRLSVIEEKLDGYKNFKDKCDVAYNKSIQNEKDIENIKDANKWLMRTILGQFITLIGGAIALYLKLK